MDTSDYVALLSNIVSAMCQRLNNLKKAIVKAYDGDSVPVRTWGQVKKEEQFLRFFCYIFSKVDKTLTEEFQQSLFEFLSSDPMQMREPFAHGLELDRFDVADAVAFCRGVETDISADNLYGAFSNVSVAKQHIAKYSNKDFEEHMVAEKLISKAYPTKLDDNRTMKARNADMVQTLTDYISNLAQGFRWEVEEQQDSINFL